MHGLKYSNRSLVTYVLGGTSTGSGHSHHYRVNVTFQQDKPHLKQLLLKTTFVQQPHNWLI